METTIRRLEFQEIPRLTRFAEGCFREAFGSHFEASAFDRLCATVFAQPVYEGLCRSGVWFASFQDEWQGYVALGEEPCPIPELPPPVIELARLYVPARWQGTGVADALMDRFLAESSKRNGRSIWLEAYDRNPRALAFYRRWGFQGYDLYELECEGLILPHRAMGRSI
jgi:diamine N-acetyltransferase